MYNGGQNYTECLNSPKKAKKYAICVDWFEVTLETSIESYSSLLCFSIEPPKLINIGDFTFELQAHGTKFYRHLFKIYYHGEAFGTLCANPRSDRILDGNWCQFKIDNHKLYQSNWITEFDEFMGELDAKPRSFTRIDVALDGRKHLDIYSYWNDGKCDRLGRAKVIEYKEKVGKEDNVITGVDWGSRGSDKYMTIYTKGRLLERENKPYISDFWKNNGLINEGKGEDIQRMELKMRSKAIQKIVDFDYQKLDNPSFLASMMRTHFEKWFQFVVIGVGNVSRRTRYEFIDWDSIGGELMEKNTTRPSNDRWSTKVSIKRLYMMSAEGLIGENVDDVISDMILWYGLEDWFQKTRKHWNEVMKARKKTKRKLKKVV